MRSEGRPLTFGDPSKRRRYRRCTAPRGGAAVREHAFARFALHSSFCRIHKTLRMTPDLAAAVVDHGGSMEEIVGLLA